MTAKTILASLLVLTIGGLGGHTTGFACEAEPVGEGIGDLSRVVTISDIELVRDANGEVVSVPLSIKGRRDDDPSTNAFILEIKKKFGTRLTSTGRVTK